MDTNQRAKKIVDAATGRDPAEQEKRSARAMGLPPIGPPVLTGTGKPSRKPRRKRREGGTAG